MRAQVFHQRMIVQLNQHGRNGPRCPRCLSRCAARCPRASAAATEQLSLLPHPQQLTDPCNQIGHRASLCPFRNRRCHPPIAERGPPRKSDSARSTARGATATGESENPHCTMAVVGDSLTSAQLDALGLSSRVAPSPWPRPARCSGGPTATARADACPRPGRLRRGEGADRRACTRSIPSRRQTRSKWTQVRDADLVTFRHFGYRVEPGRRRSRAAQACRARRERRRAETQKAVSCVTLLLFV